MANLQALFQAIAKAEHESVLRTQLLPLATEYFAATKSGFFVFERPPEMDPKFRQLLDKALSIEHNPLMRYLVERHAPVHNGAVTSPKTWKLLCPRADHRHAMAGLIVVQGQLVGAFGAIRKEGNPAFETQDLLDLSALCLHLSSWMATVEANQGAKATTRIQPLPRRHRLTPRELEIADLVAKGYTNAAIGTELWITENSVKQALKRMFRKLEVSSRTEMVTQLLLS